ncbi:hypothetical protein CCACVL1_24525 [Corchorus capsularis]|uniref:Uncharacterized protein n=1 Tax=Corchorus capsularis TaxID=210143 RepID=A0A1R3GP94_COCAP|nr:hypothetical protein CCACVL1_24525 [Corchorus capsularis]
MNIQKRKEFAQPPFLEGTTMLED